MREERRSWQGILSVIALLALSFKNSFESLWSETSIGMRTWSLCNVVSACTQWAMPAMVVLVGSVFLAAEKRLKVKYIWRHCIPSAIISCVIWWALSAVVWMKNNHPQDLDLITFRECMADVLEAPASIGFCQMLVTFFVLFPLLHTIAQNQKITQYGIILIFAMSMIESIFRYIPYLSAIALFTDQLNWGYYRAWTFYLLCGAWITKYELDWKISLFIYSAGIISTGALIALTSSATMISPGYANDYLGYRSPFTGIQTLAICLFIRRVFGEAHDTKLTRISKNIWHCAPILFIVSTFTERLMEFIEISSLKNILYSAMLNAIFTFCLILALGMLPGFRILVGDYSHKGGITV